MTRRATARVLSLLSISASLIAFVALAGPENGPPPTGRLIDVDTHQLHAYVMGEGFPTVVIDSGIGSRAEEWRGIQKRLARVTRVVTYDRAGYGESEPGPLPRDSAREADELKTLLKAGNIQGPFLLVGHSLGALNLQIFAHRYPQDVAGLVLLDPPPLAWMQGEAFPDLLDLAREMTLQWQEIADQGLSSIDPGEKKKAAFFAMIASEHRELLGRSAHQAAAIDSFGDIPLVAVAAGVPNPAFGEIAQEYQELWIEETRGLSRKSSQGRFALAETSSHQIHRDASDLVVSTIVAMVKQAGP